jgi:transposase
MDDIKADANGGFRRIEVLSGPTRRRRWSVEDKARIVAETLEPGASVSEVARRRQVCSQQVFTWRREARAGHLALPAEAMSATPAANFVPIVTEAACARAEAEHSDSGPERTTKSGTMPSIEIRLAGAVVRVAAGASGALLTEVLRAVRASAA